MSKKLLIQNYIKIEDNKVHLNGELVFHDENSDLKTFLKKLYKNLKISYPKFFKMDSLSKLAFLSAEVLLKESSIESNNMAIVLSNNASSLDTDRKHQESINDPQNYFPSPAVFVYTLPNIGIGEISIRHQIKSENAFFIFEEYNPGFHYNYENSLVESNKSDSVLAGWVNIDEDDYKAFLYLVTDTGKIKHTAKNLKELYKN